MEESSAVRGKHRSHRKNCLVQYLETCLCNPDLEHVVKWWNRNEGIFQILWVHGGRSSYQRNVHGLLFDNYRAYRGRRKNGDAKQSFRMALEKSPCVASVPGLGTNDWRFFKFIKKCHDRKENLGSSKASSSGETGSKQETGCSSQLDHGSSPFKEEYTQMVPETLDFCTGSPSSTNYVSPFHDNRYLQTPSPGDNTGLRYEAPQKFSGYFTPEINSFQDPVIEDLPSKKLENMYHNSFSLFDSSSGSGDVPMQPMKTEEPEFHDASLTGTSYNYPESAYQYGSENIPYPDSPGINHLSRYNVPVGSLPQALPPGNSFQADLTDQYQCPYTYEKAGFPLQMNHNSFYSGMNSPGAFSSPNGSSTFHNPHKMYQQYQDFYDRSCDFYQLINS